MKRFGFISFFFSILLILSGIYSISAQIGGPPPGEGNQFAEQKRPKLLEELGLTQAQIQQLRRMNANLQPQMREAQRRFHEASLALDEAIYSDELDESIIQQRLRDTQLAQAEVLRNRTLMETSVRKILTKDQLLKFKQLRQRFMQKPKNQEPNPDNRPNKPNRQLQRRIGRPII